MARPKRKSDPAAQNFAVAVETVSNHPLFSPLFRRVSIIRREENACPQSGWAVVGDHGHVHIHPKRRADPDEWVYVLAHCLLHLGLGHFEAKSRILQRHREWTAACDCAVTDFLGRLKLGRRPVEMPPILVPVAGSEEKLFDQFCESGIPEPWSELGVAGPEHLDMLPVSKPRLTWGSGHDWRQLFGLGVALAVTKALNVAAGKDSGLGLQSAAQSPAQRAREWFISSYPLLGALAAAFTIIEDAELCRRMEISVAAVDVESKEIYLNPMAGLDHQECRFVMAHELLHVGLRHQARRQGRDSYLWNVACDFVINGWLVDMGIGDLPNFGGLHDPELKGLSAEALYDRMVLDMRRYRKLVTFRGCGIGDILERGGRDWWAMGEGIDLDEFYRRCLTQGLVYHETQCRGLLPSRLVEEIRALSQPPIPWDVELAQWFDRWFAPVEKVRTYSRPSRRQQATPDIPRPTQVPRHGAEDGRTFGVVLDTSGSMDRLILAKALGAIASYSMAREVPAARVIFCDAAVYDQGYMRPEEIAHRVRVKGRGGTVLQPAVDLLDQAEDFPSKGPLLLITDGQCDRLRIRREHAFLMPQGRRLPFIPKGRIFRIR
ncbi:MAG: VWA-like domain-containing protein [Planctomycetota bacterium]|nr:VWA-like domain-containing protein [Planctomycetota bacterium]